MCAHASVHVCECMCVHMGVYMCVSVCVCTWVLSNYNTGLFSYVTGHMTECNDYIWTRDIHMTECNG